MSARLLLFSRKQDKLLWFLKPSLASSSPTTTKTLVPFSSSSFFRSLSTVPSTEEPLSFVPPPPLLQSNISQQTEQRDLIDDDDLYGDEYSDRNEDYDSSYDVDEEWWKLHYRRKEDNYDYHYWDAEKLIKLFSSTKPPRIPYIFPKFSQKKNTYFDTGMFDHILSRLYKCGQDSYAEELLDEILDYRYLIDDDDLYGNEYSDGDEDYDSSCDDDEEWWKLHYRREEDNYDYHYWDAEKLIKLFSSTKPPRIPYIFPKFSQKKNTYLDTCIFDHILSRLYKCGQDNYAKYLLDEILDYGEGLSHGTKDFVFNEWKKRVKPGEPVDGKYMVEAVSKICYGHPPVESINPLLIKLSRCGHAETAVELVYRVRANQSLEVMNTLLNGLGKEEKVDKMNRLLHNMIEVEGDFYFASDESSFRIVVYHLCRLQRVDEALEVLDWLEIHYPSKPPYLIINNMITKALCKVGRQEEGLALVDRMRSRVGCAPDIVTYNTLIDGFCKAGEIEKSQRLFDKMNEERVPPDVTTLNTLVAGMCKHGDVSSAFDFFMDMRRKGLNGNATTYTSLITGFCNTKNLDKAMDLFNEMASTSETLPNIAIYNVIIDSLCKEKRTEDALFFMDKMNVKGLFPNVVTYNAIFRGLRATNSLDKAFKLMDSMKGRQASHPNDETMEILSDWLSAEGETTRLKTFISSICRATTLQVQ